MLVTPLRIAPAARMLEENKAIYFSRRKCAWFHYCIKSKIGWEPNGNLMGTVEISESTSTNRPLPDRAAPASSHGAQSSLTDSGLDHAGAEVLLPRAVAAPTPQLSLESFYIVASGSGVFRAVAYAASRPCRENGELLRTPHPRTRPSRAPRPSLLAPQISDEGALLHGLRLIMIMISSLRLHLPRENYSAGPWQSRCSLPSTCVHLARSPPREAGVFCAADRVIYARSRPGPTLSSHADEELRPPLPSTSASRDLTAHRHTACTPPLTVVEAGVFTTADHSPACTLNYAPAAIDIRAPDRHCSPLPREAGVLRSPPLPPVRCAPARPCRPESCSTVASAGPLSSSAPKTPAREITTLSYRRTRIATAHSRWNHSNSATFLPEAGVVRVADHSPAHLRARSCAPLPSTSACPAAPRCRPTSCSTVASAGPGMVGGGGGARASRRRRAPQAIPLTASGRCYRLSCASPLADVTQWHFAPRDAAVFHTGDRVLFTHAPDIRARGRAALPSTYLVRYPTPGAGVDPACPASASARRVAPPLASPSARPPLAAVDRNHSTARPGRVLSLDRATSLRFPSCGRRGCQARVPPSARTSAVNASRRRPAPSSPLDRSFDGAPEDEKLWPHTRKRRAATRATPSDLAESGGGNGGGGRGFRPNRTPRWLRGVLRMGCAGWGPQIDECAGVEVMLAVCSALAAGIVVGELTASGKEARAAGNLPDFSLPSPPPTRSSLAAHTSSARERPRTPSLRFPAGGRRGVACPVIPPRASALAGARRTSAKRAYYILYATRCRTERRAREIVKLTGGNGWRRGCAPPGPPADIFFASGGGGGGGIAPCTPRTPRVCFPSSSFSSLVLVVIGVGVGVVGRTGVVVVVLAPAMTRARVLVALSLSDSRALALPPSLPVLVRGPPAPPSPASSHKRLPYLPSPSPPLNPNLHRNRRQRRLHLRAPDGPRRRTPPLPFLRTKPPARAASRRDGAAIGSWTRKGRRRRWWRGCGSGGCRWGGLLGRGGGGGNRGGERYLGAVWGEGEGHATADAGAGASVGAAVGMEEVYSALGRGMLSVGGASSSPRLGGLTAPGLSIFPIHDSALRRICVLRLTRRMVGRGAGRERERGIACVGEVRRGGQRLEIAGMMRSRIFCLVARSVHLRAVLGPRCFIFIWWCAHFVRVSATAVRIVRDARVRDARERGGGVATMRARMGLGRVGHRSTATEAGDCLCPPPAPANSRGWDNDDLRGLDEGRYMCSSGRGHTPEAIRSSPGCGCRGRVVIASLRFSGDAAFNPRSRGPRMSAA
ncbi:hypothetical protein DFH09DRAFT_1289165 [Mycena vulgaris]|nr:hypothetical protein DFH09DRAFT_1289165 [Mycena vulgaris]